MLLLFNRIIVFHSIFKIGHGLHYLIFMGRNLEKKRKLTPVRIMKSVHFNSKNIVNTVGVSNDSDAMNSVFNE